MSTARFVPSGRRRKSCDYCTKRKKRCDGKTPCSFCIAKNRSECHYSVRLLTGPKADSASKRASKGSAVAGNRAKAAAGAASRGVGVGLFSTGGHDSAVVPLKRPRLSPSLATGLVGLRENVFIGDFFRMMGFLPFTTESFIRKAIVSTMFRTMQERNPGIPDSGEEGWRREGTMVPTAGGASGVWPEREDGLGTESKIESAAAACVLWCTIGVGCLTRGHPKSSVDGYVHLAREALSVCFDDGSVHTARAFTTMAFLQIFLGNVDKFNKFIRFAKTIVGALPPEEVPVDLNDTLQFMKANDMTDHHKLEEEDLKDVENIVANGYEPCSSMVKDTRSIQQADLLRWLVKTDIRLVACAAMDMRKSESNENGDTTSREAVSPVSDYETIDGGDGAHELSTKRPPHVMYDEGVVVEANTAGLGSTMPPHSEEFLPLGELSQKFAADALPECQLLSSLTQSPNIRGGIGELYSQIIMAYVCIIQGHQEGAMDGLWRCTDIFVKNPGICRFTTWTHMAHCVLGCLVLSGFEGKYEELRDAYNSVVEEDSVCSEKAPPIEEWSGMTSLCKNIFCKSVYNFLAKVPAPTGEPVGLSEDALTSAASNSTTGVLEAIPFIPKSRDDVEVDVNLDREMSHSSSASDDSWARRIFAERLPADPRDGKGQASQGAPAEAATRVGSASAAAQAPACRAAGFVGAFGDGAAPVAQPPEARGLGMGSVCGPAAGSSAVLVTSPPALPPTMASSAEHGTNCAHPEEGGAAPLLLLSSVPSASAPSAPGEEADDLELLDASELEGPNAAGLLDALDAFLGDAVLEGVGEEVSSEEDLLPLLEGNI